MDNPVFLPFPLSSLASVTFSSSKTLSLNKNSIMKHKLLENSYTEAAVRCKAVEQTPTCSAKVQGNKWTGISGTRISCFSRLGQPGVPVSHPLAPVQRGLCLQMQRQKNNLQFIVSTQKLQAQTYWNDQSSPEENRKRKGGSLTSSQRT